MLKHAAKRRMGNADQAERTERPVTTWHDAFGHLGRPTHPHRNDGLDWTASVRRNILRHCQNGVAMKSIGAQLIAGWASWAVILDGCAVSPPERPASSWQDVVSCATRSAAIETTGSTDRTRWPSGHRAALAREKAPPSELGGGVSEGGDAASSTGPGAGGRGNLQTWERSR